MLFSSYTFVLGFLPVVTAVCLALASMLRGPAGHHFVRLWLLASSLFFYGYWNPAYLPLLFVSMGFNYAVGRRLERDRLGDKARRATLMFGVAVNLGLLGYYKYADFVYGTFRRLAGAESDSLDILLPLGISFFTFQQIGYLVDRARRTRLDYDLLDYLLFVVYFPQLIAGPIVCHRDIIPQFRDPTLLRPRAEHFAVGLSIFFVGLFKKIVIADQLAEFVGPTFAGAAGGVAPTTAEAWLATAAYTFQLYFDFSGYSDMAIGLARLCGLSLPVNFASPYKAANIAEFWRRWHITLSTFLRDHIYVPLGGNRCSRPRRYLNLLATMTLGGLWHGAGWSFVLWGLVHGLLLSANHAWRGWFAARNESAVPANPSRRACFAGAALTFLCVSLAWVLFRAADLATAARFYRAMFACDGFDFATKFNAPRALGWTVTAALAVWCLPNTAEIFASSELSLAETRPRSRWSTARLGDMLVWRPTALRGGALAVAAAAALAMMGRVQEFLYFQF